MAETIQTFVDKIRTEAVEAGRQEADELLLKARQEAEEIVARARRDQERILAEAQAQARAELERSRTELALASRDAVLRLRDALGRALRQVLALGVAERLADGRFLEAVLHAVIESFAKEERDGERHLHLSVPAEMRDRLASWAIAQFGADAVDQPGAAIDLKGTLRQAGFDYNVTGANVEVTVDSVVEVLGDMVSPRLREVIQQALAEGQG